MLSLVEQLVTWQSFAEEVLSPEEIEEISWHGPWKLFSPQRLTGISIIWGGGGEAQAQRQEDQWPLIATHLSEHPGHMLLPTLIHLLHR